MSLFKSGFVVAFCTFLSRIFGLVRELCVAAIFGTGTVADSVNVAFKLPNLFRRIFAEGALSLVFIPLFNQKLSVSEKDAKDFAGEVFGFLILILLGLILIIEIFMPQIIFILAPGFHLIPEKYALTILLSRITMSYLLSISLVALYGGILNSTGKFFAFAISPVIMNIVIISCTFCFKLYILPEYAISISITIAGLLQLVLMLFSVHKSNMLFKIYISKPSNDTKTLTKGLGPAILTSGVAQLNLFISQSIASFIPGAVSILSYAERIYQFPLSIIGIAFGTILLPKLSKLYKMNELKEANKTLNYAIKISLFLSVPCFVGICGLKFEIINIIYQRGAFTEVDTINTANAMAAFAFGLPAFILIKVLMPAFYAKNDTKTPLKITIYSLSLNSILNVILMYPFGHIGIALGSSIAAWVNILLILHFSGSFVMRSPNAQYQENSLIVFEQDMFSSIIKIIFSSSIMLVFILAMKLLLQKQLYYGFILYKACYLLAIIIFSIMIYLVSALLLRIFSQTELRKLLCKKA
jgi:putative peptidoglycan lipid II flippase